MKKLFIIITSIITLTSAMYFGFFSEPVNAAPFKAYEVYIDGRSIGFIKDKNKLEKYIDNEQQSIKKQYNVKKVYMPLGVKVQERSVFVKKFISERSVYNTLKKAKLFAIDGYVVTIHNKTPLQINVLDKKVFTNAVDKTVRNFVDNRQYDSYIKDEEVKIEATGSKIDNLKLQENITIKKGLVSTGDYIYKTVQELNKYLLFGTLDEQKKYKVLGNEDLEQVAYKNNLSIEEVMVANPEFKNANTLLYPGQILNVGLIKPLLHVEMEKHVVSDKVLKYDTETEYDATKMFGYEKVIQSGENGLVRVTEKIKYINGEIIPPVITISKSELKPTINKVVIKGGKQIAGVGSGAWRWPTIVPYTLSSPFGYRWGRRHTGLDISGCGHGSPIFASNAGVVTQSGSNKAYGISVIINHKNGYWTLYGHLSKSYVKVGQVVARGQIIGAMGNTGRSYGTHLHFEIRSGDPKQNGTPLNPARYL